MFNPATGYPQVVPYVRYTDPDRAIHWLETTFEGTETVRLTMADGRIGHAEVAVGAAVISVGLAAEPVPQRSVPMTRANLRTMNLVFVADVDEALDRALALGGSLVDPAVDQPWGLRQAIVADPEGYAWELSEHLRDVSPEDWGASAAT
jgi:PhnB protein